MSEFKINEIQVKSVLTKSNLLVPIILLIPILAVSMLVNIVMPHL